MDRRKKWKLLNQFLKKKKNSDNNFPNELKIQDSSITINDPQKIANHLNKHFVTKGPKLASKLPNLNQSILKYMGNRNPDSMSFRDFLVYEVVRIVNKFECTSTGYDNIPACIIKWSIELIAPFLTKILNKCVHLGVYPDFLKIARVTPLFKKGGKIMQITSDLYLC